MIRPEPSQPGRIRPPDVGELFRWADQLPSPLWDDVASRCPREAADATGAVWQNGMFRITLIGRTYRVDPTFRRIIREDDRDHRVSFQTGVVLLSTLARSLGVPASGRMVTPRELKGGSLFFTGAHSLAVKPLEKRFGNDPRALLRTAETFGGNAIPGADCAVYMPGLPFVPLYVLLWRADEEFSARAVIGIDDRALFHLDLAAIFAMTNIMVNRLVR